MDPSYLTFFGTLASSRSSISKFTQGHHKLIHLIKESIFLMALNFAELYGGFSLLLYVLPISITYSSDN
jgi:hypothetical protein